MGAGDLAFLEQRHKRLFLQIQDRFFEIGHRKVPAYLQVDNPGENEPEGHGWVALQWNPEVRGRYQQLLRALAQRFDGRIAGVNLPETAVGVDVRRDHTGFNCDTYFAAELENHARGIHRLRGELSRRGHHLLERHVTVAAGSANAAQIAGRLCGLRRRRG